MAANYDIGPRVGMNGVDEFQANTSLIEANLKALGAQMKLVAAEFEGGGDAMGQLEAEGKLLADSIALTKDKLANQNEEYAKYAAKMRELEQDIANAVGQQQKAAQAVTETKAAYVDAKKELETMGKTMADLEDYIGEATEGYGEQSAVVSGLQVRLEEAKKAYAAQEKTVAGLADELDSAKKAQLDSEEATLKANNAYAAQATKMTNLETRITKTKTYLEKLSREAEENADAFDSMGGNMTKTEKVLSSVGSAMATALKNMTGLGKDAEGTGSALKTAGDKALSFGDAVKAIVVGDVITKGFDALKNSISAIGGALKDAASAALDFAKSGIEVASDLDEVQNVVDVTFGEEGAAAVEDFANSAAKSFGMSALSAKEYTGTMGAMLKSMQLDDSDVLEMSQSLTGLAGDIASFYNLDVDEAFSKIRSGISGETEPLKQLGINMSVANMEAYALSQGITTAWNDMDQASQAALRYSYLMSVTADAQGDFARTSDSYANQQRILELNMENLSATIGSKLLPTVTKFTSLFNDLLGGDMNITTFAYELGYELGQALNKLGESLPDLVDVGVTVIGSLVHSITAQLPLLLPMAADILSTLAGGLMEVGGTILDAGGEILGWMIEGVQAKLPDWVSTGMDALMEFLWTIIDGLPDVLETGWDILMTLAEGILEKIPEMVQMLPKIISALAKFFTEHFPEFVEMGGQLIVKLASGLVQSLPDLIIAAGDLIEALLTYFIYRVKGFLDIGKNIVTGIWEGISEKWTWLKNKITGWISNIKSLFTGKDGFDTHSPSKWSEGVFENVMKGAEEGLEAGEGSLLRTAAGVTDAIKDSLTVSGDLGTVSGDLGTVSAGVKAGMNTVKATAVSAGASQNSQFDSAALTAAFQDALKNAAVYMDGRKVGRLVSTSQSNTARAMGV